MNCSKLNEVKIVGGKYTMMEDAQKKNSKDVANQET
jgi:hypothetical protein